jgi:hypothetical protein
VYQQAQIPVADARGFQTVHSAIETAFSAAKIADFLRALDRSKLRVRDFEGVLRAGKLGPEAESEYGKLGNGDQGQIREFYLASLEQVDPEIRNRFFKLYAYY